MLAPLYTLKCPRHKLYLLMQIKESVVITKLELEGIQTISAAFEKIGWSKPLSLFKEYYDEQETNHRNVWVAWKNGTFAGYVTLKWDSDYPNFAEQNIPEIKDLNVLPEFRRHGIGSSLLNLAEAEAQKKRSYVGLGVGLFSDYGNAQRLYVKRGYIPDGHGITYKNKSVKYCDTVQVDDNLILWFIKKLI